MAGREWSSSPAAPPSRRTLRIGWRAPGDHVSIAVYAENLLNNRYYRTLNTISADILQTPYVRAERPGFYGVELGFRF